MSRPERLLARLDDIGTSLARRGDAVMLIGLGSVGVETSRIDEYSDLDFFAIVQPGRKSAYLDDLKWLEETGELAYSFRNTPDGFKILFADGIYGEFAVFEPAELSTIPYSDGRIVWKADGADESMRIPVRGPAPMTEPNPEWCVGEALTCLYVGVCRFRRGERLAAQRLVQHVAVERVLEMSPLLAPQESPSADPFSPDRRFEQRFPTLTSLLPNFIQGYDRTPESASEILGFLRQHFELNPAMVARVEELIAEAVRER